MQDTHAVYRGSGQRGVAVDRNPGAAARVSAGESPSLRVRLGGGAFLACWGLARRLPEPVVFVAADLGGRVVWALARGLRAGVRRNLARVVPAAALDGAVRKAFRSYARYWVESFRCADLDAAEVDRRTTTAGFEHMDAALERGKGVIVLLAHHGSWDMAARWAEEHGYHLAVVAEVLKPRPVFERFVRLREAVGLEVIPLTRQGHGGSMTMRLSRVLAANHLVGLLADRDLRGSGEKVRLFGDDATLPRGTVVFSQRLGAVILPITMLQRPRRRWHLQVLPPVEVAGLPVEQGVQRVAQAIERLVLLAPEQWHAFSPMFAADRA